MASARGSCRIARAVGAVLPLNWLRDAPLGLPTNSSADNGSESTRLAWGPGSLDRLEGVTEAGATLALRALIAGAYLALGAVGLVGNTLVLVLVRAQQRRRRSLLNCFLLNFAATDLQFVLTLPFWSADTVRDFSWPFGGAMCKVVLTLTVLNMYASSFFLSAMSVVRYCTVANALRPRQPGTPWAVCVCCLLWAIAVLAIAPTALFATAARVGDERLCLLRFPNGGPDWLAFYHLQNIAVAFVLPLATLGTCSLLLLRFLRRRRRRAHWPSGVWPRRRSQVTRTLACVLLTFVLCWLPNQALTLWGALIKLNALPWDRAYFLAQAYLFPVSICLAHSNSCLNPLLYCRLRSDFRQGLRKLCGWAKPPADLRPGPDSRAPATALSHQAGGQRGTPLSKNHPPLYCTKSHGADYVTWDWANEVKQQCLPSGSVFWGRLEGLYWSFGSGD